MEDFIVKGGIRVPIGYRFLPTDEELVDFYLKRKVFGLPLPSASIIPDQLDVFNTDPWTLPGDLEEKRYFFGKKKVDVGSGNKCTVVAGSGYWKCNGKTKKIFVGSGGAEEAVGLRTTLVFRQGKRAQTGWVMREYRLVLCTATAAATIPNSTQSEMRFGDWVVHCIFQRKKKSKKKRGSIPAVSHDLSNSSSKDLLTCTTGMTMTMIMNRSPTSIDFTVEETDDDFFTPPQPCASACMSDITVDQTTSNGFDDEVNSACYTDLFYI